METNLFLLPRVQKELIYSLQTTDQVCEANDLLCRMKACCSILLTHMYHMYKKSNSHKAFYQHWRVPSRVQFLCKTRSQNLLKNWIFSCRKTKTSRKATIAHLIIITYPVPPKKPKPFTAEDKTGSAGIDSWVSTILQTLNYITFAVCAVGYGLIQSKQMVERPNSPAWFIYSLQNFYFTLNLWLCKKKKKKKAFPLQVF